MTTAVLDKEGLRVTMAEAMDTEVSAVTDSARFLEDLKVDSLLALEVVVVLEKKYGVHLEESDFEHVTCLENTYNLLLEKLT